MRINVVDPNYPQLNIVFTRFGNGYEIYEQCRSRFDGKKIEWRMDRAIGKGGECVYIMGDGFLF